MDRQYVGIDFHRRRSVIVRLSGDGDSLGVHRIANDPFELSAVMGEAGEHPQVVIEATYGWYWAVELTEIRQAFRQRLAIERVPKKPARRKWKPQSPLVLVRELDYDDAYILTPALVAELFAVSPRTVRRWADVGALPSFRTIGGQRRFRWGEIRRVVAQPVCASTPERALWTRVSHRGMVFGRFCCSAERERHRSFAANPAVCRDGVVSESSSSDSMGRTPHTSRSSVRPILGSLRTSHTAPGRQPSLVRCVASCRSCWGPSRSWAPLRCAFKHRSRWASDSLAEQRSMDESAGSSL
jgi:excisionase family DNA binding protein